MGGVDNLVNVSLSSLNNCAVQLPSSWANPLLNSNKKPQQLVFELNWNSESTGKPNTLFVSWSGLAATQKDNLVIDRGYAQAVGLTSSDRVSIRYVSQVPKARSIELVPLTVEDWEELNAGFLEDQFLNQCRVVAQGQIVTLWVKGQTRISLKVVNTQPQSSTCVMLQESSEIHVQPMARKKEAEVKSSEDTPTLPSRVLRLVAAVVLGNSPPLLFPNVMTVAVHPGSILSLSETSRLDLAFQDYPTLVTLSPLTRDFDEKLSSNRANNSGNSSNTSSKNPEETSQAHALPRTPHLVVTVIWSSTVPIGVVLAPSLLVSTLFTPFRFISRVQLSFQLPTLVQTRQLGVRPFFPASPVTSSRKKRVDTSPANFQENQTGLIGGNSVGTNSNSRSWITQAISTWFKNQEDSSTNMAITQGMLLTLPDNGPVPLTISVDLGVPAGNGLAYSIISADEWARISKVESEPAQFVSPILLAQERQSDTLPITPQLGAVEEILNRAFSTLRTGLALRVAKDSLGVAPNVGVLICGARGSGKTSVLKVLQNRLQSDISTLAMCHSVECGDLINERVAVIQDQLEEAMFAAAWYSPGVVVLDNLDSLLPAEMEHMDSFRFRQLSECFVGLIKRLRSQYPGVALLATAIQSQTLHPLLLASHTFTTTLHLSPPGKLERQKMLEAIIENSSILAVRSSLPTIDLSEISGSTEGYLPADLKTLIERATHQAAIRQLHCSSDNYEPDTLPLEAERTKFVLSNLDFQTAQEGYTPVSLRGVKLQVSTVRWSDIGGLEETRKVLRETLEWPIKYQAIFQSCPLRLRSGLMLYGYPGCGKTMLASAVARECQLNFITVKGPEILNKYIGASEQSVRDLFQRAQAARPCVLFFDEFEAIAPRRGHDSTGVTDRVVNQLLTQMDGAEGLEGVYVLAATSRPDLIDPALLRPGRLDKSLLCHLPTATDRLAILSAHASKFHFADGVENRLVEVAAQCQNFSGADLQALLYNAHLEAIHQTLDSKLDLSEQTSSNNHNIPFEILNITPKKLDSNSQPSLTLAEKDKVNARLDIIRRHYNSNPNTGLKKSKSTPDQPKHITTITWEHITKALESTNPSLPSSEITRLSAIYDEFQFGKGGGDKSKVGKKSTLG